MISHTLPFTNSNSKLSGIHILDTNTMDLKQLRCFVQAAEQGSLLRAAEQLNLSQPTLSRQIKTLEQTLNVRLFQRTGRGVALTEAGRRALGHAQAVLENASRLQKETGLHKGTLGGRLSFGLPPSVGVRLTAPLVERFRARYPNVSLRLVEDLSGTIQEGLLNDTIDLGILYEVAAVSGVQTCFLGTEDLHLVCDQTHALASRDSVRFDEIVELPLILPGLRHGLRALVQQYAFREGLTVRTDLEVDSLRVQVDLVRRGLGVTLLPGATLSALRNVERLVAIPVVQPSLQRSCVLAWRRGRVLNPAATAMTQLIQTAFNDDVQDAALSGAGDLAVIRSK